MCRSGLLVERPRLMQVSIARIPLNAGARRRIMLTVPLKRLAFFGAEPNGFAREPGLLRLVPARHSEDGVPVCTLTCSCLFLGFCTRPGTGGDQDTGAMTLTLLASMLSRGSRDGSASAHAGHGCHACFAASPRA